MRKSGSQSTIFRVWTRPSVGLSQKDSETEWRSVHPEWHPGKESRSVELTLTNRHQHVTQTSGTRGYSLGSPNPTSTLGSPTANTTPTSFLVRRDQSNTGHTHQKRNHGGRGVPEQGATEDSTPGVHRHLPEGGDRERRTGGPLSQKETQVPPPSRRTTPGALLPYSHTLSPPGVRRLRSKRKTPVRSSSPPLHEWNGTVQLQRT